VLLVRVAALADAALELHAPALLNNVRRFVSRRVEAGRAGERDAVAGRVRLGADRAARRGSRAADVGIDAADVVAAEQLLDRGAVRQRAAGAGDAGRSGFLDRAGVRRRLAVLARGQLHRREIVRRPRQRRSDERALARRGGAAVRRTAAESRPRAALIEAAAHRGPSLRTPIATPLPPRRDPRGAQTFARGPVAR